MADKGPIKRIDGVLYVSNATQLLDREELEELLITSRRNNERDAITGLLLYKSGSFMQYIEGPGASLQGLLQRLEDDDRHRNMTVIHHPTDVARAFPNWRMAYSAITENRPLESWLQDYLAQAMFDTPDHRFVRDYVRNFNRLNR